MAKCGKIGYGSFLSLWINGYDHHRSWYEFVSTPTEVVLKK
jgi:hypothetical protein